MKIQRWFFVAACAGWLPGCSGGPSAPAGWQPVQGAAPNTQWSTGSGATLQTYTYERRSFTGTLQELTSQQATAVASAQKAHFVDSDAFASCPGQAAVANYTSPTRLLIEGIAVRGGSGVLVTYARPVGTAMPPEVAQALAQTLCNASL